jgi:predicted DCC family thiol-disulfide oxidoreductase YuxK
MTGSISQPRHVAHPPPLRPVLLFDGECAFCRRWVDRWRETAGDGLDLEPVQTAADRFPEIPPVEFARAVQLIDTDGRVFSAAEAIIRARAMATHHTWLRTAYERLPGFAPAAEAVYRFVARHRLLG